MVQSTHYDLINFYKYDGILIIDPDT